MPEMYLDVDAALTEVPVNLLALTDDTDFVTRETGIVYNQAGMDLVWNFVTSAGVQTQTAVTPTTAGDYDWAHAGDGMYTIEMPASGGASINNDTEGYGWFTGICTGVLHWRGPIIGFRAAELNDLMLDSAYSATRGLAGTALPAVAADGAGGLPISDAGGLDLDNEANTAFWTDPGTLVDLVWDEVLTGGTHNVAASAGRRLRGIQDFQGYENGAVWLDTNNGTAGTTDYESGTVENPVDTIADALTIMASLGLVHIEVATGSSITFAANMDGKTLSGRNWTLALGGQSCSDTVIAGSDVSGTCTGANKPRFERCVINAVTLPPSIMLTCGLANTITVGSAGDFFLIDCSSLIAGTSTPTFGFGAAVGNTNLNMRNYSGGINLENMGDTGTDTASIEGRGQVVEGTCTGGVVAIRGNFTASGITNLTLSDDARFDSVQLIDDVWDEVLTGAAHNIADSAGRRVRNLQEFGNYEDNRVWIDTINGAAGTTDYESGTILNKVDSVADSNTLGTSLGLEGRGVAPGSSITFIASQDGQDWKGNIWTLALGGQSISDTHIFGANVSGICTGANPPEFHECIVGNVTVPPCVFRDSDMGGTVTLPVGTVHLHHCAGEAGSILDYGAAVADTTVHWTDFSGDLVIDNLGQNGTDILYIRGHGKITFNASCIGGTVYWDGHFTIIDNGSDITFNSDDISTNVESLITSVGALNDPTAAAIAAAVYTYNMGNGRTIGEALAFLRNKWTLSGGTLTVYDTDDSTVLWTSTVVTTAGDPVSSSDPA